MEFKKWLETSDISKLDPMLVDPHVSQISRVLLTKGLQAVSRQIKAGASEEVVNNVIQAIANHIEKIKGPKIADNFLELAKVTFQLGMEHRAKLNKFSMQSAQIR